MSEKEFFDDEELCFQLDRELETREMLPADRLRVFEEDLGTRPDTENGEEHTLFDQASLLKERSRRLFGLENLEEGEELP